MARPPRRPPTPVAAAGPFLREQGAALRYTAQWHRVLAWAERAVDMEGFDRLDLGDAVSARVERLAASCVRDWHSAEEAYESGLPLERLRNLPYGPRMDLGGKRRVVITALTWLPDFEGEVGYDAQWITIGKGMSAHEAAAAVHRFVKSYADALKRGVESRRLIITVLEVKFWTQASSSEHV